MLALWHLAGCSAQYVCTAQTPLGFMIQVTAGRCCYLHPSPTVASSSCAVHGNLYAGLHRSQAYFPEGLSRVSLWSAVVFRTPRLFIFCSTKCDKQTISLIHFREQPQSWKKAKNFLLLLSRNNLYINCFTHGFKAYTKWFSES